MIEIGISNQFQDGDISVGRKIEARFQMLKLQYMFCLTGVVNQNIDRCKKMFHRSQKVASKKTLISSDNYGDTN